MKSKNLKPDPFREKIEHPYKTPEGFFDNFGNQVTETIKNLRPERKIQIRQIALSLVKYAAALVIIFFAAKGVWLTIHKSNKVGNRLNSSDTEIEAIYSQISDEDITQFIASNSEEDLAAILDF